jgi:hypothetical protein
LRADRLLIYSGARGLAEKTPLASLAEESTYRVLVPYIRLNELFSIRGEKGILSTTRCGDCSRQATFIPWSHDNPPDMPDNGTCVVKIVFFVCFFLLLIELCKVDSYRCVATFQKLRAGQSILSTSTRLDNLPCQRTLGWATHHFMVSSSEQYIKSLNKQVKN